MLLSIMLCAFLVQLYIHFRYLFSTLYITSLPTQQASQDVAPVSIIIAARNEARHLPALIEALCTQNYPQYEVIIVNDRSEDDSVQILLQYSQLYEQLTCLHIREVPIGMNPKKYAITQAVGQARYDWVLLIDADCLPASPDWIRLMMQTRQEATQIVLGISPYEAVGKGGLQATVQYETFYTMLQYIGFAIGGRPYMGVGRNLLYYKPLFTEAKGFGRFQSITGGDDDLFVNGIATAKNTRVSLHQASYTYSVPPYTWRDWLRQKTRHVSVGKHYKFSDKVWLGALYASQGMGWLVFLWACLLVPFGVLDIVVLSLWGIRCTIVWTGYTLIINRLQLKVSKITLPYFDFMFPLYIFTVGILATLRKKIKWKN